MSGVLFLVIFLVLAVITAISILSPPLFFFMLFIDTIFLLSSIRIFYEYERGILFTLGKYSKNLQPGLNFIVPIIQWTNKVDLRLYVANVPPQSPITKDNVSITVDAVIYYKVMEDQPEKSVIKVENFHYAINQLAQTTLRNVIGEMTLNQVLSNRDEVSLRIRQIVDEASDPWGIKVISVELKRIELPEQMKIVMAKAAAAERIKRAVIIKTKGEAEAAKIVKEAASIISSVEGGLNLRTLQSLGSIASDPSNEVVFFVPLDTIQPLYGYKVKK
ncbi:MAG: slipin family protein [Candidatus Diapherotrites archaeon]